MAAPEGGCDIAQSPHGRHLDVAALLLLLALTAIVRFPGLWRPLLGNFATKQAVYAMVARNWAEGRAELWYPTLDVLRGSHRSLHMVELPVSAYLTAAAWRCAGGSLDVWGRATALLFSLGSVALLFRLVRGQHDRPAAVGAGLALALAPVNIIYGQSFMLEASLIFFALGSFYALERWLDAHRGPAAPQGGRRIAGALSRSSSSENGTAPPGDRETGSPPVLRSAFRLSTASFCLALLLLTKIYMVVIVVPLGIMALRAGRGPKGAARWALAAALVLATLPAVLWYALAWQTASPDGPLAGRVFYSVRGSLEAHRPPHPLLFSADFYRGVLDDLTGVVLTPLGFGLALAGLLDRRWRRWAAWLAVSLLLVVALPRKFHEMNYYWMAVLPPLCILVGLGWRTVWDRLRPGRMAVGVILSVGLLLSLRYAVKPAFVTPAEDRAVPAAARAVQLYAAEDEPVVTVHGTSLDLLYYCDRPGWAISPDATDLARRLADSRRQGARYAVAVGVQPAELGETVVEGEGYGVYRLP